MMLISIVIILLVIFPLTQPSNNEIVRVQKSAKEILSERYAKGEINYQEYQEILKHL